jgi:hypothetical protein
MAKGNNIRSNKEAKKPKKEVAKPSVAVASGTGKAPIVIADKKVK